MPLELAGRLCKPAVPAVPACSAASRVMPVSKGIHMEKSLTMRTTPDVESMQAKFAFEGGAAIAAPARSATVGNPAVMRKNRLGCFVGLSRRTTICGCRAHSLRCMDWEGLIIFHASLIRKVMTGSSAESGVRGEIQANKNNKKSSRFREHGSPRVRRANSRATMDHSWMKSLTATQKSTSCTCDVPLPAPI